MKQDTTITGNDAPRLRLASHIDLGKADADCANCNGTGIVRREEIEERGKKLSVPVICRCVSRNDGVQRDMLDKLIDEMHEQVTNGTFAENLAGDIMRLPEDRRVDAVAQIRNQIVKAQESGDTAVEKQLKSAVARITLLRAKEN